MNALAKQFLLACGLCVASLGCASPEKTVDTTTVAKLDLARYMGTWYEIARLPNHFEHGLIKVKATYTMLDNGKVRVYNEGVHQSDGEPSDATGRAHRPDPAVEGQLRVSFVPPYWWFYGDYNVLYISEDYQLALVSGSDADLLWLLARGKTITDEQKAMLLEMAQKRGFDTSKLIWTPQDVATKSCPQH